jgi:hypothetical protein
MTKRKAAEITEAKAEMIYWATGRTKIYPEKNFAKNYAEIKAMSEKKRERKHASTRSKSNLKD